jgi:hypothetical protein
VPQVTAPLPLTWHKGLIEKTLPEFTRPDAPLFVLIDVDLLESASVILGWLNVNGRPGDLVYFDEAFDSWNEGLAVRRAVTASEGEAGRHLSQRQLESSRAAACG